MADFLLYGVKYFVRMKYYVIWYDETYMITPPDMINFYPDEKIFCSNQFNIGENKEQDIKSPRREEFPYLLTRY